MSIDSRTDNLQVKLVSNWSVNTQTVLLMVAEEMFF